MSKIAIHQYYQNLDRTLQFGKSTHEPNVRFCFQTLLNEYTRQYNYEVVSEISFLGETGKTIRPDRVVKNLWGVDIGYGETKNEKDDIDIDIRKKFAVVIHSPISCLKTLAPLSCIKKAWKSSVSPCVKRRHCMRF